MTGRFVEWDDRTWSQNDMGWDSVDGGPFHVYYMSHHGRYYEAFETLDDAVAFCRSLLNVDNFEGGIAAGAFEGLVNIETGDEFEDPIWGPDPTPLKAQ